MKIILLICLFPLFVFGGGAINFDGVDDYVEIGDDDSLSFTDGVGTDEPFSIAMWLYPDSLYQQGVMAKRDSSSVLEYLVNTEADEGLTFRLYSESGVAGYLTMRSTPLTPYIEMWSQIVFVYDGSEEYTGMKIYLNGDDISTIGSESGTYVGMSKTLAKVRLGVNYIGGWYLNGSIGEVLIYNKALSPEEIKRIYTSKNVWYPKNGLVSRWTMENNGISTGQPHPNGSTIKDSVGSNDGTIVDGSDNSMTLESSPTRTKRGRR